MDQREDVHNQFESAGEAMTQKDMTKMRAHSIGTHIEFSGNLLVGSSFQDGMHDLGFTWRKMEEVNDVIPFSCANPQE